ncbi:hypothetical protein QFC19_003004 [Naganishia cerealis]|uniref:Uncharacterized protein n=1 Tax=Naganishia cerealis TaxID=610337 RepID=A0ACC2W6Z7_9TREE|nr:hypothetical protein QFC19_003004 [Naganishia cerealis]
MNTTGKAGTFVTGDVTIGFIGGVITDDVDVVSLECRKAHVSCSNLSFFQSQDVAVSKSDIEAILQTNVLAKASLKQDAGNTLADIRNANKTPLNQRGIDLLLMASPPPEIALFSRNAPPSGVQQNNVPQVSDFITAARPRYILWSAQDDEVEDGQSAYWEREPFGWDSTGKHKEDRFTRAVKLDTFGGSKGAKKVSNATSKKVRLDTDSK